MKQWLEQRKAGLESEIQKLLNERGQIEARLKQLGEEEQALYRQANDLTARMLVLDGALTGIKESSGQFDEYEKALLEASPVLDA